MSAASGSSYKKDILALTGEAEQRYAVPLLLIAALASAVLIFVALGDWIIAAGFAAAILGMAALGYALRPGEPAAVMTRESPPDWSITRAAANASGLAIAVTDHAGQARLRQRPLWRMVYRLARALPALPFGAEQITALVQAGRVAARDGEGRCDGLVQGATTLEVHVTRTGRADDYLLWHFQPVRHYSAAEDFARIVAGDVGRQLGDAGLMAAIIGGEGRIRIANEGVPDPRGRPHGCGPLRPGVHRIFPARRAGAHLLPARNPVDAARRCVPRAAEGGSARRPALVMLIDQPGDATLGGTSLSYLQGLLALMPFGIALADRTGGCCF
jgi:two-component system cell cycle sensor histidine kinase/response regulator CckA